MPDQPNLPRPAFALVVSERAQMWDAIGGLLGEDDFVLLRAPSRRDVLAWTRDVPADVVFVDDAFEDGYGLTLFAEMEQDPRIPPWTPRFVVHDGPVSEDRIVQGLAAGAWDVLLLPAEVATLRMRLHNMVRGKLQADAARENSLVDEATGVYTWEGLVERIDELGALAYRNRRPIACVAFGLDLDHAIADNVDGTTLRALAGQMANIGRATVRRSDPIGLAGSPTDFLVIAPDTNIAGARVLARRLASAVDVAEKQRYATRAGYYGVNDMLAAEVRPVDLLLRAARALRAAQAGRLDEAVRFYDVLH